MFGFLKADPTKKLQKKYEATLKKAVDAQRGGNIELYAELTAQAEEIRKEMEAAKASS